MPLVTYLDAISQALRDDKECFLASVRKTSKALIVNEAHPTAGFGAEVAAVIAEEAFESLDAPVKRVGALDVPIPFSPLSRTLCCRA